MLRKRSLLSCSLATSLLIAGCQQPQPAPAAAPPPPVAAAAYSGKPLTDLEQLAERLVKQSAGIVEGELVLVSGGIREQELLENIAVHVRKVGAFPLVQLNSDRMTKRLFFDVPEKFDAQADKLGLEMAGSFNTVISVNYSLDESALADADPKRLAARAKAGQPVVDVFLTRKVKQVEVGNGLYPTRWLAERFGLTEEQLAKTFWDGVNVDYSSLASRADQVKHALAAGSQIEIKDSNGTDLRVNVKGRPVFASDGIITAEEARAGGAASNAYLPAGEVYVTPVAGTAEGKIVRPKEYFEGKEIQNLTLTFAAGKLTSMTGSGAGFAPLKALYDAAGAGKDLFAVVDFGVNPNVTLPADAAVGTWVPAGTVTVGIGNNVWAGGTNKSPYAYFASIPGATVTLDGKTVIEKGQIKF